MAGTPTPRLGLHGPTGPDSARIPYDLDILRGQLDEAAIYRESADNTRPAANAVPKGTVFRGTTSGSIWVSDGTNWIMLNAPVVTSLPSSPVAGDRCVLQTSAMVTAKVRWRVAYNGTKWEFEGGQSLFSSESSSVFSSASSPTLLGSFTAIDVPVTGRYRIEGNFVAGTVPPNTSDWTVRLRKDTTDVKVFGGLSGDKLYTPFSIEESLTAGQDLAFWGHNSSGDTTVYAQRLLKITPVEL